MMQLTVNVLGTLVAGLCAVLLLRAYGSVRKRLLLWAGLVFRRIGRVECIGRSRSVIVPEIDLYRWRLAVAATAMLLLVYGLIFESDRS